MRSPALMLALAICCGAPAAAADQPPGNPDTIHVNATRDPEVRKYAAIVAGLDSFDKHRHLAPKVDVLRFRIEARGAAPQALQPVARIEGEDGFVLPLEVDEDGRFTVPRSEAALHARGELTLNQKRRDYRVVPIIRSPGLAKNQRRLGDLRLTCKVNVAIAKEEIALFWVLTVNTLLRSTDWCSFFDTPDTKFTFRTGQKLAGAVLHEGERSLKLDIEGRDFRIHLVDEHWSDDALVELEFATPAPAEAATGTAAETPRTGT